VIIKKHFTPASIFPYVRFELGLGAASSVAAWLIVDQGHTTDVTLPLTVATVLGTALSILLAVRANTSYQRWWEGSGIWAQLVGSSRNLVRVVISVTDAKPDADRAAVEAFQHDVARRQVAYAAALRAQLRRDAHALDEVRATLAPADHDVLAADNPALQLLARQSRRIFAAYRENLLSGLDNFQMETALAALSNQQALAERITGQPVPRTYDVFSRYLVHLYTVVFPFAVIGSLPLHHWLVIPATLVVAFAFRVVERIGTVVEFPFANTTQDVPLSAIGAQLERDLRDLLGDTDKPPAPQPVNGYLW